MSYIRQARWAVLGVALSLFTPVPSVVGSGQKCTDCITDGCEAGEHSAPSQLTLDGFFGLHDYCVPLAGCGGHPSGCAVVGLNVIPREQYEKVLALAVQASVGDPSAYYTLLDRYPQVAKYSTTQKALVILPNCTKAAGVIAMIPVPHTVALNANFRGLAFVSLESGL